MMFGKKKTTLIPTNTVEGKLRTIEALGSKNVETKKKRKGKDGEQDSNANLYKLMHYLRDEEPQCRIAAANALKSANQEVVVTHLCWCIRDEKDEEVIKVIKEALASVRANMAASGIK